MWVNTGSVHGLLPGTRAITRTHDVNWGFKNTWRWYLNGNTVILCTKMHRKLSSATWRPFHSDFIILNAFSSFVIAYLSQWTLWSQTSPWQRYSQTCNWANYSLLMSYLYFNLNTECGISTTAMMAYEEIKHNNTKQWNALKQGFSYRSSFDELCSYFTILFLFLSLYYIAEQQHLICIPVLHWFYLITLWNMDTISSWKRNVKFGCD